MAITVFILLLLAKLLGFIGLIVIIYGFKSNNVGNIKKGTILFCLALIFAASAIFMVGKRCVKHYKNKVKSIEMIMTHECCSHFTEEDCTQTEEVILNENGDTVSVKKEVIKIVE